MYTIATWIAVSTIAAFLSFAPRSEAAEVVYDAQHGRVTLKVAAADVMPAMDARGARSLQVFEDGVRQRDVDIDVAHAPVSLAVLPHRVPTTVRPVSSTCASRSVRWDRQRGCDRRPETSRPRPSARSHRCVTRPTAQPVGRRNS